MTRVGTGEVCPFEYLDTVKYEVWIIIAVLLFILSILSSKGFSNIIIFYEYLFNYFIMLFSKSMQHFLRKSKQKLFIGFWLIVSLVLSTLFTSYLLDHMIKADPLDLIDSLEELSKRKDMSVLVRNDSSMISYVELVDSDVTKAIKPRIVEYFHLFEDNFVEMVRLL